MRVTTRRLLTTAAAIGALGLAGSAQAQEFKLRWGHYLGNSPFLQVEKDYAKRIGERTKDRVKIDMTFAGGLGKQLPQRVVMTGVVESHRWHRDAERHGKGDRQ